MRDFKNHGVLGGVAVATAVAAALAFGAHGAQAHTPEVSDSCSGLQVSFQSYEGEADNNRLTVTIDGKASVFMFGTNFAQSFPWSSNASHTWSVDLDANLAGGDPESHDFDASGTQVACDTPTTSSVPDTTSTTVPVTTSTTVPVTTSTTVPDTTSTTVPDTTSTTVPDTTSTTVPDTTSTTVAVTVTDPPSTPAPTTPAPTPVPTTDVGVVVAPPLPGVTPAPPTAAPPVVPATLPQTGGSSTGVIAAGLMLLGAGSLGLIVARRQRGHA